MATLEIKFNELQKRKDELSAVSSSNSGTTTTGDPAAASS
jgi:hypothetical protein